MDDLLQSIDTWNERADALRLSAASCRASSVKHVACLAAATIAQDIAIRLMDMAEQLCDEQIQAFYRCIATRRIRLGLVLAEIGRRHGISVSQEDINRAVMEEARRHPGQEQKVVDFFRSNQAALAGVQAQIVEDKIIDLIVDIARVTEREVTPEEMRQMLNADDTARRNAAGMLAA